MLQRGRHLLRRGKGFVLSHLRRTPYVLAYSDLMPARWSDRLITLFWEEQAKAIHAKWGSGHEDYVALGAVLSRYRPLTLLDAGCGSGRLFPLYEQCGIARIVGVDVSEQALDLARSAFPRAELGRKGLADLDFADDAFDLCVCSRVLQHIPPVQIQKVVANLARIARWVYINELTQSDDLEQAFFMRRHDYDALFGKVGMRRVEGGMIGKQTYNVFGRGGSS